MVVLFFPSCRIRQCYSAAFSCPYRRHAGPPCHGDNGTHPETASLVRSHWARGRLSEWTSWNAPEVATTFREGLACITNRPWRLASTVHGIANYRTTASF